MRFFGGLFHLAENLGLAQHHRIEAGGDAEGVIGGFLLRQQIQIGFYVARRQAVEVGHPFGDVGGFLSVAVNLGAVAGRKNRRFTRNAAYPGHIGQGLGQNVRRKRHPLADGNRSGMVVNAAGKKLHFSTVSIRARQGRAKQHGRGYAFPVFDYPMQGEASKRHLFLMNQGVRAAHCTLTRLPPNIPSPCDVFLRRRW